ncbi:50S ribosomal protein L13 [Buchnera aphidicola]|uniref:50S ribosomal protein L13 n=1 Tax=Buchnera aphidicola TaxID=9 RepID=UPI0005C47F45|nr:50S ribosomal protein L13 [Buchnera aphidicola]
MKSFSAKSNDFKKMWYCIDATGKILGRLATNIASRLRGKHKVEYTPHVDIGDYLIVINAKNIKVTGKKCTDKFYYHHTGYVGGLKKIAFKDMLHRYPERIIEIAVRGMLPKGPLGRSMFKKLKVYANDNHNHSAQNPKILNI